MSYFGKHFWVLYHCVKQGPAATKELADFIRQRTFAPLWEVFRVSSDKLALCHLDLTRKLHDLIRDVLSYGDEQLWAHKKCKEEVLSTLDAVEVLAGVSQLLPKSCENYLSRCMDLEGLRRENTSQKELNKADIKSKKAAEGLRRSVEKYKSACADFETKMLDSTLRFQGIEETYLQHMKALLGSYAYLVEDTHVQIGQDPWTWRRTVQPRCRKRLRRSGFRATRTLTRGAQKVLNAHQTGARPRQRLQPRDRGSPAPHHGRVSHPPARPRGYHEASLVP